MPWQIPVANPHLNVTYEFGLMSERNGWFMEVSIDDKFLFVVQKDSCGEFVIDFCWSVGGRYSDLLRTSDLDDVISTAKRCYAAHDVSHFNVV